MNNLINLEIPVGTTDSDKVLELRFDPHNTMHYYINGSVGTGKTNLLRSIALNAAKKYSQNNVVIWTISNKLNEFADLHDRFPETIINIDALSEEAIKQVFIKLENEINNRIKVMHENGLDSFYNNHANNTLPQLLILIDDYYFMGCIIEKFGELKTSFKNMITKANALGISFVLADQLPKNKSKGISLTASNLFKGLISLDNVAFLQALELSYNELSDDEEKNISHNIRNFPGAFAYKCFFSGKNQIGWAKSHFVPNETPKIHKTPHKDSFPLFESTFPFVADSTDYDISRFVNRLANRCIDVADDFQGDIRRLIQLKEDVKKFDMQDILKKQLDNVLFELDKLHFIVQSEYKSTCNSYSNSIVKDSGAPLTDEEIEKQMALLLSNGFFTDNNDDTTE